MVEKLNLLLSGGLPAVVGMIGAGFFLFFRSVMNQKRRNTLNEIDLSAQKINLDNHSKPIDDLVSESNKSHAAGGVVETPRADDKKK